MLVPVCGAEPRLASNLRALRDALTEGDRLVVGAALADDPALEVARNLEPRPGVEIEVVAGSSSAATNRKVATLVALEPRARRDVIVLVDSDVTLDAGLLGRLVSPLSEKGVGVATALYRGVPAGGLASRLEALAINADFVPSVLVARALGGGIDFALGAANAVRREALEALGGFAALGEVLADDHHLGKRAVRAGFAVRVAPVCVPIALESSLGETLARLLRWCRTYRVCQPAGYAATIFSHHGVACSLAALVLAALAGRVIAPFAVLAAVVVLARVATAALAHRLVAGPGADLGSLTLLPLRDVVATGLFALAWCGRTVTWRGRTFRVAADGTMIQTGSAGTPHRAPEPAAIGGS